MASKRAQLNVRMDEETAARFERLQVATRKSVGVDLSQAQIVAMALVALEEKYPPEGSDKPPTQSEAERDRMSRGLGESAAWAEEFTAGGKPKPEKPAPKKGKSKTQP